MGWIARLKALDDRVLPKPKPGTVEDFRRATLIGIVGVLVLISCAVVFRATPFLYGATTIVILTGMNAARWRRFHLAKRDSE